MYSPPFLTPLGTFIVYEVLSHSANTRLPLSWPASRKRAIVEDVIQELGLHGVCPRSFFHVS